MLSYFIDHLVYNPYFFWTLYSSNFSEALLWLWKILIYELTLFAVDGPPNPKMGPTWHIAIQFNQQY